MESRICVSINALLALTSILFIAIVYIRGQIRASGTINMIIKVCVLVCTISASAGVYTTISSKANNVTFRYMKGVRIQDCISRKYFFTNDSMTNVR